MISYRKEVDGLRAVAVLSILLFHAGLDTFSGGFVGVDVFFVISGYLITSIILKEKQENTFSLLKFYERRARRILPALFLMMFICIPLAWLWLLPNEMMEFAKSTKAVALFFSNHFFYKESGYFDTASESKPLLHTWSLAVEEQYYLFFPIIISALWRFGKKSIITVLLTITFASFFVAQWGVSNKPAAAFFLLPARGWELLLGALLAFYLGEFGRVNVGNNLKQLASVFGLLLILCAVFLFDKTTPFPGIYALVPTFGAALVILFAAPSTFVGAILGSPLFVGAGLISYSTYLWHQPLFVFARHISSNPISDVGFGLLCLISLAIGYVSWRLVERPFRLTNIVSSKAIGICAFVLSASFIAFGYVGQATKGFDGRYEKFLNGDVGHLEFHEFVDKNYYDCEPKLIASQALKWDGFLRCKQSKLGNPQLVLLGDSHAEHLFIGLAEARPDLNIAFYILSGKPFISNPQFSLIYKELLTNGLDQQVILTMHYIARQNQGKNEFYEELGNTIKALQASKKGVILVGDVPLYEIDASFCLYRDMQNKLPKSCSISIEEANLQRDLYLITLKKLSIDFSVRYIDLYEPLCGVGGCSMVTTTTILYRDKNHLNIPGSKLVGHHIAKSLASSKDF